MAQAPKFELLEVKLWERDAVFRLPFRFGVVTLTEAPQAFCQVRIKLENGQESSGVSAELMVPKWFDKDEALSNEDNFDQLRMALCLARQAYLASGANTAFGLMAANYARHIAAANLRGLNPLTANFGTALIDKAAMDAVCRAHGVSFADAIRTNISGISETEIIADLAGFGFDEFLDRLAFQPTIHARHTVGMIDPLTSADQTSDSRLDDGLPETLQEIVEAYGHRYFKIKVRGDTPADIDRLKEIASVLDRAASDYRISLDGNEQYDDAEGVLELISAIESEPSLATLWASTLFIEQPIKRTLALSVDIHRIAKIRPVIIDESDDAFDIFLLARERGYQGVSSKTCKGFYKSIINAARCQIWNLENEAAAYFLSAEDLTCQGGVAVQQDLALVSLLGIKHVERNGHHYVKGMAGADLDEQKEFLETHQGLYRQVNGKACLKIEDGLIDLSSLICAGYATAVVPNYEKMTEMELAVTT